MYIDKTLVPWFRNLVSCGSDNKPKRQLSYYDDVTVITSNDYTCSRHDILVSKYFLPKCMSQSISNILLNYRQYVIYFSLLVGTASIPKTFYTNWRDLCRFLAILSLYIFIIFTPIDILVVVRTLRHIEPWFVFGNLVIRASYILCNFQLYFSK